jgi:hypothetical protein
MAVARARPERFEHVQRLRVALADGRATTLHVARHDLAATQLKVALVRGQRLAAWCAAHGVGEALVGGFFTRPDCEPLGEVRTSGILRASAPFDAPWDGLRACVHVCGREVRIARRDELPAEPPGDLLQAGPLLVRDGAAVYDRARDPEGFSAGASQFDSDITAERHPRAALAVAGSTLLAVACDGRSRTDAGLTLEELAGVLAGLGADTALNLDGGGSTTLVAGGRLRNRPRAGVGVPEPGGRAVATALVFQPA